ncbi:hypothetical protein IOD14_21685 [Streptomyces sp. A2-16]|uniref:hypothetical protein n=1 Tax=Streptomyces sp. A2-16 TaxID=2781734 RepID=UPI001BB0C792|nr:hypothetical protein [Streptomyces sp. A2-16]QUC59174.1 hypothetical protein IOD14_21685 [Streptomyces sp. A2-16]
MAERRAADQEHPNDRVDHADHYDVRTHAVSGQVIVGRHNTVTQNTGGRPVADPVTEAELAALRAEFARLRDLVPEDEPDAERARELLDELEESATAPEPDLSTMEYVLRWFRRRLPALAGAVTSLILHPVVGHLVEAAGVTLAEDFRHRFGGT